MVFNIIRTKRKSRTRERKGDSRWLQIIKKRGLWMNRLRPFWEAYVYQIPKHRAQSIDRSKSKLGRFELFDNYSSQPNYRGGGEMHFFWLHRLTTQISKHNHENCIPSNFKLLHFMFVILHFYQTINTLCFFLSYLFYTISLPS